MSSNVVRHPSSRKRDADVHERFNKAVKMADAARNVHQLGILSQFDDEELAILGHMLCDNDRRLLKLAGRKI